jgi:hypothetical protein
MHFIRVYRLALRLVSKLIVSILNIEVRARLNHEVVSAKCWGDSKESNNIILV